MPANDPLPESPARRPPATSWTTPLPHISRETRQRYLLLFVLALLLTAIILPRTARVPSDYLPGDIALHNVKAPRDLLIEDQELTEKKRAEAYDQVARYYDFDAQAGQELAERLVQAIQTLHTVPAPLPEQTHRDVEALLGVSLTPAELRLLATLSTEAEAIAALRTAIVLPYNAMVVTNLDLFTNDRELGVVVRDLRRNLIESHLGNRVVIDLNELHAEIARQLELSKPFPKSQRQQVLTLLRRMLRPDLTFNRSETEFQRQQQVAAVRPVLFQIKRGEMVVREGERVSEEQVRKLRALASYNNGYQTLINATGLFIVVCLLFFVVYRFGKVNIRKFRPSNRDLGFLTVNAVLAFITMKLALLVSTALESAFPSIAVTTYHYLFPFAAGTMLVRIVLNSEIAFFFAVITSMLFGVLFGGNLPIVVYAFIGSMVGAHWVKHCKERSVIYRAGARMALVNVLVVVALQLLTGHRLDAQSLYGIGFALLNGMICAAIVNGTIPAFESLFRYTTDIKLLELANLNNPVLRELMIQAPGTYHHSVVVGNLVEAAAESIKANPLLARVAAYYHDVGKTRKPLYFIENMQGGQENRHDKLSPSMSALILIGHVKDGVEIAREHRLGTTLIDVIQQHHGTALMKFFYEKAKQQHDPDLPAIDEYDYRYPGPKPQTREAALIMLADAVEAASRTLTEPTPARIQGMVQKIINNIFIDGQLDECELTLKDLHLIARSFNQVLAGIYHQRIDYPQPAYKERDKDTKRKTSENPDREPPKETKDQQTRPAADSPEDLKRLGMS